MDKKLLFTVFASVFLAEMGDKTQLATMLFASNSPGARWTVFLGASLALVLAAGIGVLVGDVIGRYVPAHTLTWLAGLGFIGVGIWTIAKA